MNKIYYVSFGCSSTEYIEEYSTLIEANYFAYKYWKNVTDSEKKRGAFSRVLINYNEEAYEFDFPEGGFNSEEEKK